MLAVYSILTSLPTHSHFLFSMIVLKVYSYVIQFRDMIVNIFTVCEFICGGTEFEFCVQVIVNILAEFDIVLWVEP